MSKFFIDYQHLSNETHFFPRCNTSLSVSIYYIGIYQEIAPALLCGSVTGVKQG